MKVFLAQAEQFYWLSALQPSKYIFITYGFRTHNDSISAQLNKYLLTKAGSTMLFTNNLIDTVKPKNLHETYARDTT
jgi:hypothetical protein